MKIHWTETAAGHLDAIYAYISHDSPEYALRMIDHIHKGVNKSPHSHYMEC